MNNDECVGNIAFRLTAGQDFSWDLNIFLSSKLIDWNKDIIILLVCYTAWNNMHDIDQKEGMFSSFDNLCLLNKIS